LVIEPRLEKFYWTGAHEPEVQQALRRCLRPGATFWDVGAHIGFFSLIASRLVGPDGQVHAFEPLPANVTRLRESLALNASAGNVTLHPWAIAATPGQAPLQQSQSSLMGTLRETASVGTTLVTCVTLDAMAETLGRPDLIKIDVEGTEDEVLAGGRQLLEHGVPTLIVELLSTEAVTRARTALPQYGFIRLDATNWLLQSLH
jgi:FkbM family methyltransferase